MNADQIAQIRPAVQEAIDGAPDSCVTFEIEGDPDKWMQVVDHTINSAFPHADDPEERLKAIPGFSGLSITAWEAENFVTLEAPGWDATALAEWIAAYLVMVLGCEAGDYDVDVTYEKL